MALSARSGLCLLLALALPSSALAHKQHVMLGLGDSIGEGVQSADASISSQRAVYLNWIALKLGAPFGLPLIQSWPFGRVGSMQFRSRILPSFRASNLAVSGADVASILDERADAASVHEIESETDLVLFPRLGSQVEIAEALDPSLIVCWIGNNDALGAVTSFDELDASQLTPLPEFERRFREIAHRLGSLSGEVVFGNVPDVAGIGFLMGREDLIRFLGADYGLEDGDFTTIATMFMIRLGFDDGSLIGNPAYVLDASEVALVQERIDQFNRVIDEAAGENGAFVVDINAMFREFSTNPPTFFGVSLTPRYLGGILSLDGVHPSNIAHAAAADAFIAAINSRFQTSFPRLTQQELERVFLEDPFVDKDRDGRVTGRPLAGLLETLAPLLGISGDSNDWIPIDTLKRIDPERGRRFMERYHRLTGKPVPLGRAFSREDAIEAMKHLFGTAQPRRQR
jgi:hypothetical protein